MMHIRRITSLLLLILTTFALHATPPLPIGQIQGRSRISPQLGREVTVDGVVTADFSTGLGGWFIQDSGDNDPLTSDALFVLSGRGYPSVPAVGQQVRVRGEVTEHGRDDGQTLTALRPTSIEIVGQGFPILPLRITTPPDDWEALEGMLLRLDAPLTISGQHALPSHGVMIASFDGRLYTPTELAPPGAPAQQHAATNARRRVLLDDASASTCRDKVCPLPWYLPADTAWIRTGSQVTGATGILDQRWGEYRLQLTAPLTVQAAPRPPVPEVSGDLRLAVFNLQNLFNGDGQGGGFPTARGARTAEEFSLQLQRLVSTIHALAPDVAALMELEHDGDGPDSSIAQLTAALNRASAPDAEWRFVETGLGTGRISETIRVGMVYRADRVQTVGSPALLRGGPFVYHSRIPLAQAFRAGTGPVFVIVANHFKSKGCRQADGDERDQGDGQGCWNPLRVQSAIHLRDWLQSDPTGHDSELIAIVGDLNAYTREDPIQVLHQAGWQDAFAYAPDRHPAPEYSYVFDGQSGHLDHALLSPALARHVAGAVTWHSNADEPEILGWRTSPAADSGQPWRSSDHDPMLIGLWLNKAPEPAPSPSH